MNAKFIKRRSPIRLPNLSAGRFMSKCLEAGKDRKDIRTGGKFL